MGKGNNKRNASSNDVYQVEQVHKKHRAKSEKIKKRIEKKRNRKNVKAQRFEKRTLAKFILKQFHEHKKKIDINRIPFDFNEIEIAIKKIIAHKDKESIQRILVNVNKMEKHPKEINVATFENKAIIKDVCKLFKTLRVHQNPKFPLKYSLYHMFKKKDAKTRYTTNVEEIIPECLDSYYLLVKCLFEYYYKKSKDENNDENVNENEGDEESEKEDKEDDISFDKDKYELDVEYEVIHNQVGNNAEFINKAFNRVMNDNGERKRKEMERMKEIKEKEDNTNLEGVIVDDDNDNKVKGNDFLKMTMDLLH